MLPTVANAANETQNNVDPSRFGQKAADEAFGAFQRGLYKTALNLALERAAKGDAAAQTLAAEIYARGLGTAQNLPEAARLYNLAAEKGIPEAQFQAALFLIEGRNGNKDTVKAKAYLEKAVAANHTLAAFNLAQLTFSEAKTDEQRKSAFDLFQRAANAGLADAQYAVSQFLANGTAGVPFDEVKARSWLEKAAVQNYDTAQLDLGSWLIDGVGGKKNYDAGFLWTKRAAEIGNVEAQRRLAHLYEDGIGNPGDQIAAAAWYVLARRAGLQDKALDNLLDGLTPEELKKAIEMANRLK
ncbi:MAG: tetratricopeptide repeat protein [Rhizobiaceae bacterium]